MLDARHDKQQDTNAYDYYQAIKEYENKNYEKALAKLDTLINLKNNDKIEYWAKYWRGCTYYNLAIDKIQKREPFTEVKQYFANAKDNFQEAKAIDEKFVDNKEYNKQEIFIAFCKIAEAGSCYCLGKLTLEKKEIEPTDDFKEIKSYFCTCIDLCKQVISSIENNKVRYHSEIEFKILYTAAASYLQLGKIDIDEQQIKVKMDSSNEITYSKKLFTLAKSLFEKAIEINPKDEYAWIGKGNSSFALKDYRDSIKSYNFAIHLNYDNVNVWYFKGLALHNLARYEEAIDCYMNSITITKCLNLTINETTITDKSSPFNESTIHDAISNYFNSTLTESDLLNEIGNSLYNLRLYDEALKKYKESLWLWKSKYSSQRYKDYKYLLNKVWCLIALGRNKDALQDLEDDFLNYYVGLLDSFNKDNSSNNLDQVLPEIKLYLVIALYLKGFIYFKNKNKDSLEYIDKAIDINKKYHLKNPYPLYLKALIYNNDKKFNEALEYLDKSLDLNNKFAEAHVAKAESMLAINNKQGAAKELNKAIEIAPNLGSAHSLLSKTDSISTDGGPKFLQFWKATKYRMIIATLLVVSAIVLVTVSIHALYGKMNEAMFGIVASLVGLIAAIILLPDIGKVKVGSMIEFDVIQESQPGSKLELDLQKPFIPLKP